MTDRGTPTPIDAADGEGSTDLSVQQQREINRDMNIGQVYKGIEALLYEVIDHALPPHLREDLRLHKPLRRKTRDNLGRITEIMQESYGSHTLPDTYIRMRLSYSVRSGDLKTQTSGYADYGDGPPPYDIPDSLTRAEFSDVYTLEDLEEERKSLINQGLLPPPEPQTTEADLLVTTVSGLSREGVQVWIEPSAGYWLDERLEPSASQTELAL